MSLNNSTEVEPSYPASLASQSIKLITVIKDIGLWHSLPPEAHLAPPLPQFCICGLHLAFSYYQETLRRIGKKKKIRPSLKCNYY